MNAMRATTASVGLCSSECFLKLLSSVQSVYVTLAEPDVALHLHRITIPHTDKSVFGA